MKQCKSCGLVKPYEEFSPNPSNSVDGLAAACRPCNAKRAKKRRTEKPEQYAISAFRNYVMRHGLTIEEYETLFEYQNGLCAICKQPEKRIGKNGLVCKLNIDHDHKHDDEHIGSKLSCKKCHRGLLCYACNISLGLVGDDVERLKRMVEYLKGGETDKWLQIGL
jgi:hypothetical protein